MRRHLAFDCSGVTLAGSLDEADGSAGLLWVGGGNEIRSGAFAGQAQLAARIARAGFPVFRFDRRGVGDSEGDNRGFRASGGDIEAAAAAFRAHCPRLRRIVAFGNCDAASALMLGGGVAADALVLANPWTIEDEEDAPPPAAVRARYAGKLKDPREWLRLFTGRISLTKLARGLVRAATPAAPPTTLAQEIGAGLGKFGGAVRILVAENDRTAQAFLAHWDRGDARLRRCVGASHAFVEPHAREWLLAELTAMLANEQARQLDMG